MLIIISISTSYLCLRIIKTKTRLRILLSLNFESQMSKVSYVCDIYTTTWLVYSIYILDITKRIIIKPKIKITNPLQFMLYIAPNPSPTKQPKQNTNQEHYKWLQENQNPNRLIANLWDTRVTTIHCVSLKPKKRMRPYALDASSSWSGKLSNV